MVRERIGRMIYVLSPGAPSRGGGVREGSILQISQLALSGFSMVSNERANFEV